MAWRFRFYAFPSAAAFEAAMQAAPFAEGSTAEVAISPAQVPEGAPPTEAVNVAIAWPGEASNDPVWTAAEITAPAPGQVTFAGWDAETPGPSVMPPNAFFDLFEEAELMEIAEATQTKAAVMLWLTRIGASPSVKLTSPGTVSGLRMLTAQGLLSADRAARILRSLPPL